MKLMSRIQAGDPDAAAELVRHYEPDIRLEVRVRLRIQDGRVRRMLDSMDITQSCWPASLPVGGGPVCPTHPRNCWAARHHGPQQAAFAGWRHQRQQRRDARRCESFNAGLHDVAAAGESPSQIVANRELLVNFANA